MKQVIFDTDIGIDDAMALLFLHYAPGARVNAIVTGFGNASLESTTRNALYVKERFGISAPVYRGAGGAAGVSMFEDYPDFVHGKNGLGDIELPDVDVSKAAHDGAQAIVDIARAAPGQTSLVAIGRLTNVARALELCPELPTLIRELIVMGGAFGFNGHRGNVSPVAEANIAGDPCAADRVFTAGFTTTIVGLDVTHEVTMDEAYFSMLRDSAGDAGLFIHDISRCYLDFAERETGARACAVHDSSAVAYLLAPDLFTTREAQVRVVTDGPALGQTVWGDPEKCYQVGDWGDLPTVRICTAVDSARFLRLYEETLRSAVDDA